MASLRNRLIALAFVPMLAGCEIDLTGLDLSGLWDPCSTYCAPPEPRVNVAGSVRIGAYQALSGEATVLLYSAADTVSPVDSAWIGNGYYRGFGTNPGPAVCAYLARAVLWSGEKTALQRLFKNSPESCPPSLSTYPGADFDFPAYAPLAQPFVITGSVKIDGAPATSSTASVGLYLRRFDGDTRLEPLAVDVVGSYRYETTDRALAIGLCQIAMVDVATPRTDGRRDVAKVWSVPLASCEGGRRLPDVRIGTRKAAAGEVFVGVSPSGAGLPAGEGVARLVLLNPADPTFVGEEFETQDDGSFTVWFPHGLAAPGGCGWMLRAELEDGATQTRPLLPAMTPCSDEFYHQFAFATAAP